MSTNPISNFLQEILTGGSSTTAPPTTNPLSIDTMSTASTSDSMTSFSVLSSPSLPTPGINLNDYARIINTALVGLKAQINLADEQSMLLNIDMWLENSAWARSLAALEKSMTSLSKREISLYSSQLTDSLKYNKNVIDTYNSQLGSFDSIVEAMNDLQTQYAAGSISDATYNAAVATWNTLLAGRNSQIQADYTAYSSATALYNAAVDAKNADIIQINLARQAIGLPDMIPLEPHATVAPLYLLPSIALGPPPPAVPTVPDEMPKVGYVDSSGSVSSTIDVTPTTPAEQAFIDSIQDSLDAIAMGSGADYNSYLISTSAEVEAMSQAIRDYQNGDITTSEFNDQLDDYLAFTVTANAQLAVLWQSYSDDLNAYNATLDGINAQITAFNEVRNSLGQALIPLQVPLIVPDLSASLLPTNISQGPPPPAVNVLDSGPQVILPPVPKGSKTPTRTADYMERYYTPIFQSSLASLMAYTEHLENQEAYRSLQLFTLRGNTTSFLPNAYIEAHPIETSASSVPGALISGAAIISGIIGLSSEKMAAVISKRVLEDSNLPQGVLNQALLFALSSIQEANLLAAMPSLALFSPNNLDAVYEGSLGVEAALRTNVLHGINGLIESGAIDKALAGYLSSAGIPRADIQVILAPLTAAVTIGLLQFGLFGIADKLQIAGLLPQVLGNISDATLRKLLVTASGKNFGDVLNDPVTVLALKANLTDQLVAKTQLSQADASAKIQQAITRTLAEQKILTAEDVRASFVKGLNEGGVEDPIASDLAAQATNYLRADLLIEDLNSSVIRDGISERALVQSQQLDDALGRALQNQDLLTKRQLRDTLLTDLKNQGVDSTSAEGQVNNLLLSLRSDDLKKSFTTDRINRDLLSDSLAGANNPAGVNLAINASLAGGPVSEFHFREILAQNLRAQGIANADTLAGQSAIALTGNNPLTSTTIGDFLNRDQLADQLIAEITNKIKGDVGPVLADSIAKQLTLAIVGPVTSSLVTNDEIRRPHSVLNLLQQAYDTLAHSDVSKHGEKVADSFVDYIKPTFDLFILSSRITDPAYNLILTSASGIMYPQLEGKNSIDIIV